MLFRSSEMERIAAGELTLTLRAWSRPQARVGGRYRMGSGHIEVTAVGRVLIAEVDASDLRRAGFANREALIRALGRVVPAPDTEIYRVAFRYIDTPLADPRRELSKQDALSDDELVAIERRLAAMDAASQRGRWTMETLNAITAYPGTRAADLASALGCDDLMKFKSDVRRLKALGLTESLEVGYRISPRGRALLTRRGVRAR